MKLKLDENFDVRLVPELLEEGFGRHCGAY